MNGQERKVVIPTLELDKPINAHSSNEAKPDEYEMPVNGVVAMQLVIFSPEHWKAYTKYKNHRVQVVCILMQAISGHHLTPVLCQVIYISKFNEL